MATTFNAKGTSYPSFTIGKRGTTLYQGRDDPSISSNVKEGDFWLDTSSGTVRFRENSTWITGDSSEQYNVVQSDRLLVVNSRYYIPTAQSVSLPNIADTKVGDCITITTSVSTPAVLTAFGAQLIEIDELTSANSAVLNYDNEINIVSNGTKWILLADHTISGGTF